MSTATATATRPIVQKPFKVELDLVKALPEDFKKFKEWKNQKPVYELKHGMVYWLYSHANNQFDQSPYIIDETTDAQELYEYLKAEAVYVVRSPFQRSV